MPPAKSLTRKQLQKLARLRLREAEALYAASLYDGCVYLAGYAVELALKARICRLLKISEYPQNLSNFKVHNLDQLKALAGLTTAFSMTGNKQLFDNWSKAVRWDPEQRYENAGTYTAAEARIILDSIRTKTEWSAHMALKVVVVGQLFTQITDYVHSCSKKGRQFVLAMLIPSDVGLSERWNFVVSAPWIDQAGLSGAIPEVTASLQQFLSKPNARKIDRVSVLPTSDSLVKELIPLGIEPGTAYRVSTFALTARGIEDAIVFAAQRPRAAHTRQNHAVRSRA